MTAPATVIAGARRVRLRAAAEPAVAAACATGLVTAALAALTWRAWGDLDVDTGYDLVAASRVAHGALPYVDFTYYYGPLAPFAGGALAAVTGNGVGSAAALGLAVAVAIVAATYVVGRRLLDPLGAFLAAAITAAVAFIPDNYSYVLPHALDATLGTLLLLVLLRLVQRAASAPTPSRLVAAGLCTGALALTKLECAVAGAFATAVFLAVSLHRRELRRAAVATVAASAAAVPLLVYGTFLAWVPPHRLFLENLYPEGVLRGNPIVHARVPLTVASFVSLGAKLALYAVGVAALLALAAVLARPSFRARAPYLVAGGLVLGVVAVLYDLEAFRHGLQYAYGWIPAGAAVALAVSARGALRRSTPFADDRRLELAALCVLAVLAASTYPGFFPHAPNEQTAAYAIPFAAVLLARLHLHVLGRRRTAYALGAAWLALLALGGAALTVDDARAKPATVRGPGGALAADPAQAAAYQAALGWIAREARPGEHILVAPFMAALYPLSGHESPLRELSIIPGALPDRAAEQEAIARLARSDVHVVVLDDRPRPEYGVTSFGASYDRELSRWIHRHFRRAAVIREPAHTLRAGIVQGPRALSVWVRAR